MDIIKDGLQWLNSQREDFLTHSVTYQRGVKTKEVMATRGQTKHRIVDEYGRSVIVFSVDFLFSVIDLEDDFTMPFVGDQIIDDGKSFEVLSIAGEPHYRFCDQSYESIRVHTKGI